MNKKVVLPVLVILLGGVASAVIATAKPAPQAQAPTLQAHPQVQVIDLKPQRERIAITSQGTVRARRQIELTAQVGGVIHAVDAQFASGGRFAADQVLLSLDGRDYDIALVRARAAVAQAQAQLATEKGQARQAQAEWRDLGSAEANDLFLRKAQLAAAHAQVSAAKADLEQARLNRERATIKAPFAGRVVAVHVNQGQYIAAGMQVAQLLDMSTLELALPVSSVELGMLNFAQSIPVVLQAAGIGETREWRASIQRSAAVLDDSTRQLSLFAEFDQATDGPVLPHVGQFLTARIEGKELDDVLTIPAAALRAGDKIWTVDPQNILHIHSVEVLQVAEQSLKVRGLVPSGMRLVVSYLASARPGMTVLVSEAQGADS
ncbi:MAG: efflux RND transporter periplasmic adaptor subunit [Oceanococcus sp.]